MEIRRVCAVYFSATGNTEKITTTIAEELAQQLHTHMERISFTTPVERERVRHFEEADLVVAGAPTYAGKLPNKILPDFRKKLHGRGALAVGIVTFGNRAYDNALAELCAVLAVNDFITIAAGAFVCRHAFTDALACGRPNESDLSEARDFARHIFEKVSAGRLDSVEVPGNSDAPYYIPKGVDGQPARFLKAKPKTDASRCTSCGLCARLCPMGSIDSSHVFHVLGVCIKCQCCVRGCPNQAKYFDDTAFLSHVAMLERDFMESKHNEVFL